MNSQLSSKIWILGGVSLLVIAVGLVVWQVLPASKTGSAGSSASENTAKPKLEATISGQQVDSEIAQRRPMAVMVENHPDSRPQSGLSKAEIVYEVVAEGGITRYLALFQKDVDSIGPVRSARDYYAELADSWGAVFAHVGGSPEVLESLKRGAYARLADINEFYQSEYFERIKTRAAPHNTYTSTQKLLEHEAITEDVAPETMHPFIFADIAPVTPEQASSITINFSLPSYKVLFTYDTTTKQYLRSVAGKPDTDAAAQVQLAPTTVIVQLTDIIPVPGDDKFRVDVRTTGSGKAYIFQNGGVVTGTWKREAGKPTQYMDVTGKSISFTPGQIWIALVSKNDPSVVTYK